MEYKNIHIRVCTEDMTPHLKSSNLTQNLSMDQTTPYLKNKKNEEGEKHPDMDEKKNMLNSFVIEENATLPNTTGIPHYYFKTL